MSSLTWIVQKQTLKYSRVSVIKRGTFDLDMSRLLIVGHRNLQSIASIR